MRSAKPDAFTASTDSPPPTTVIASASATDSRHRHRPFRERFFLEDAHRAVPEDRLRVFQRGVVCGDRFRADVECFLVRRSSPFATSTVSIVVGFSRSSADDDGSTGSVTFVMRFATSIESLSTSEPPIGHAARGEERVGHAAADEDRVGELDERFERLDLAGDLRAAEERDEGAVGDVGDLLQELDLFRQQQPAGGARRCRRGAAARRSTRARDGRRRRRR